MIITVEKDITLNVGDLPLDVVQQITSELTLDNPRYTQAARLGYSTDGKVQYIKLYSLNHGSLTLPRGYMHSLVHLLHQRNIELTVNDQRMCLPSVEFKSVINLRDYQVPAVDALLLHQQGGVVAPCGSGKTMIGLAAIATSRQPALWVCHTKELADQTIDRACQVFGTKRDEIGLIGDGKFSIGARLTVALVQTLSRRDVTDIVDKFGCVMVDEAHHLGANQFYESVNQFPAAYRFWLSATPDRSDGLTSMIFAAGGPIIHTIHPSQVPTVTPRLVVVNTNYDYLHDSYNVQMANLTQNYARNSLIVRTIATHAKGHYSLVLSDRVDHLRKLRTMLRERLPGVNVEILHGDLPKGERKRLMDRVRNKEISILLATQIAREGLDVPHLNRLFLTTPKRAVGTLEQEIGRIMRPCERKQDAVVFDFRDIANPILEAQWRRRFTVYAKLGITQAV